MNVKKFIYACASAATVFTFISFVFISFVWYAISNDRKDYKDKRLFNMIN